ncbi:hypothetical protein D0T12_29000 [Actinomadura spongiicola]|uniref:Uncharacterized protein n=1 Tax=Actinomadura spongiicola TaxID=2303421 RepID=A0A372G9H3_9ACTN|nr:hypothetical protein D0T12_29000 [Actinomadura spongiicola]
MPLDELAQELTGECRAQVSGETLVVALRVPASIQRAIATDGERFRWGSENDLGSVNDVPGAAARVLSVLWGGRRGRGCAL